MVKWKKTDVEKITGKKYNTSNNKIPRPTPAGLQFIQNHLSLLSIQYVTELIFSKKRKFRFDIAIPDKKIAIEYEGLNSQKSGHTTITGYTSDCTKYNLAQVEGWIVLRYTMVNYKDFTNDLKAILDEL